MAGPFANASRHFQLVLRSHTPTPSPMAPIPFPPVNDAAGKSASSSLVTSPSTHLHGRRLHPFASPSGNDGNSGTQSLGPQILLRRRQRYSARSVLCLLGGSYNLSSSFTPPTVAPPPLGSSIKNYDSTPSTRLYRLRQCRLPSSASPTAAPSFRRPATSNSAPPLEVDECDRGRMHPGADAYRHV